MQLLGQMFVSGGDIATFLGYLWCMYDSEFHMYGTKTAVLSLLRRNDSLFAGFISGHYNDTEHII